MYVLPEIILGWIIAWIIHEFLYSAVIPAKGRHPCESRGRNPKKTE
jgi:hypothetical protein